MWVPISLAIEELQGIRALVDDVPHAGLAWPYYRLIDFPFPVTYGLQTLRKF